MSESQQAEKATDEEEQNGEQEQEQEPTEELTKTEFFDRLAIEGATLDGSFYMPTGTGRQRRYFEYDPGLVKGFDSVREDGDVVAQEVSNHEEAMTEKVNKDHIDDVVYEKLADGFGTFGLAVVESAADEGDSDDSGGDTGTDPEYEPMDDDEVIETIRDNFAEHGFFAEDDDGEEKVVSLAHPDARLMGYITGSHVGALPSESLESVDDYRVAVFQALTTGDDPMVDMDTMPSPNDVPIATNDMMEKFREYGNSLTEEQKDKLGKQVKARWEEGSYDHLRKEDEEEGTDEAEVDDDDDDE